MKTLATLVFIKTTLILLFILYGGVHLGPDEAQYWTWSQKLAPGYYSKPPGIAYQIALGTTLFGNTELGVRFGSVVIGAIMPFLIYRLALLSALSSLQAMWAGVVWALCPLGWVGSFLAITDGGMVFFWTLACIILLSRGPGWLLGVTVGLGALFKWPIYLFWLFAFFYLWKKWDRRFFLAIFISLLAFLPALWWNYENEWVTFRHVGATLQGGSGELKAKGNFLEFLGSQLALFSPIFFILMLLSYKKREEKLKLSYLITLPAILLGAILSLFMKIQGNWAIFAYPTAPLLTVAHASRKWLIAGSVLSIALVLGGLFIPLKHNSGWDKLPSLLQQAGYDPKIHFLLSDKYQNSSILSFYSPEQKRAYFLNLRVDRLNQFSFWPSLKQEQLHQDGFFVTFEAIEPSLAPYFSSVQKLPPASLTSSKQVFIYKVTDYNGLEPTNSLKY